jgi:hypothetical protein
MFDNVQFHNDTNPEMALYQPYLSVNLPSNVVHDDVFKLLSSVTSKETLTRVWNNFIAPWFGLVLKGDESASTTCELQNSIEFSLQPFYIPS